MSDMQTDGNSKSEVWKRKGNEVGWRAWGDSNAQPLAPEANALSS